MNLTIQPTTPNSLATLEPEFDVERALQRRIETSPDASMCVGSSTGEILGAADRLDKVYGDQVNAPTMCFWGVFVK